MNRQDLMIAHKILSQLEDEILMRGRKEEAKKVQHILQIVEERTSYFPKPVEIPKTDGFSKYQEEVSPELMADMVEAAKLISDKQRRFILVFFEYGKTHFMTNVEDKSIALNNLQKLINDNK